MNGAVFQVFFSTQVPGAYSGRHRSVCQSRGKIAHGISYRTKSPNDINHLGLDTSSVMFPRTDRTTTYEIFVRPEDEHKAQKAIHSRQ